MPPKETRPGQSGAADEPTCACVSDPFASLPPGGRSPTAALGVRRQEAPPPELRPNAKRPAGGLRKTVCPACGLDYWTNRATDRCIACEAAGR